MSDVETWKPVAGNARYEVSDWGTVREVDGREVVPRALPTGHLTVFLGTKGDRFGRRKYVHRLVAEAFIGPCPERHECCHRDGNPQNNRADNLRWGTRSENNLDAVRHGTNGNTAKTHCPQGHPYSGDNLKRIPSRPEARYCRACQDTARREYELRKRAARRLSNA